MALRRRSVSTRFSTIFCVCVEIHHRPLGDHYFVCVTLRTSTLLARIVVAEGAVRDTCGTGDCAQRNDIWISLWLQSRRARTSKPRPSPERCRLPHTQSKFNISRRGHLDCSPQGKKRAKNATFSPLIPHPTPKPPPSRARRSVAPGHTVVLLRPA